MPRETSMAAAVSFIRWFAGGTRKQLPSLVRHLYRNCSPDNGEFNFFAVPSEFDEPTSVFASDPDFTTRQFLTVVVEKGPQPREIRFFGVPCLVLDFLWDYLGPLPRSFDLWHFFPSFARPIPIGHFVIAHSTALLLPADRTPL